LVPVRAMDKKPDRAGNGDSPGRFQPDGLQPNFSYWARMRAWKVTEAAALCGLDPHFASKKWYLSRDQIAEYNGVLELAIRATNDRHFGWPYTPARWLAWAKVRDIRVPGELAKEIDKWNGSSLPDGARTVQEQDRVPRKTVTGKEIRDTVRQIYDDARAANKKPPNENEATTDCAERLKKLNFRASHRRIKPIVREPEFCKQRLKPGERFKLAL
jgi:hypothetical protein